LKLKKRVKVRSISLALSSRARERNKRIKDEEDEEKDEGRVSPQSVKRIERPGLVIAWQMSYLWDAQLPWEAKTDRVDESFEATAKRK
jgi:hypothetical protein